MSTQDQINYKSKLAELQEQVSALIGERDALTRDVENLCMQTTANTTFSYSSVLSERIYSAEKQLRDAQRALAQVTADRDCISDNLRGVKEAKRASDDACRQLQARIQSLEKELAFYKKQSADAMAERDAEMAEADDLRQMTTDLEQNLKNHIHKSREEESAREAAQLKLTKLEERLPGLEHQAREADRLRKEYTALGKTSKKQAKELEGLKSELEALKKELGAIKEAEEKISVEVTRARQAAGESEEKMVLSNNKVDALEVEVQTYRNTIEGDKSRLSGLEKEIASLRVELNATKIELVGVQQKANDATQQKVDALMKLSEVEQQAKRYKEDSIRLERQLQEATAQKVDALLENAELKAAAQNLSLRNSPVKVGGMPAK
jgi:chromosome segregation ATPase